MKNNLIAYAAGIVTMTAALAVAGNWTPAVSLVFGFAIAFVLRSRTTTVYRQVRRPARRPAAARIPDAQLPAESMTSQVKPPSSPAAVPVTALELELTSALRNFGAGKTQATAAARRAIAADPQAQDIAHLVRIALARPQATA